MSQTTLHALTHIGPVSPEDLKQRALSAFDALGLGERVLLILERPPGAVLAIFQRERKGQFDWTPIAESPNSFEVEVSRRDAESTR